MIDDHHPDGHFQLYREAGWLEPRTFVPPMTGVPCEGEGCQHSSHDREVTASDVGEAIDRALRNPSHWMNKLFTAADTDPRSEEEKQYTAKEIWNAQMPYYPMD